MAYPTCRELIIDAYRISGIRGSNETPNETDVSLALNILNRDVIDRLSLDELWPSYIKAYTFTAEAGKAEYTIGVPLGGAEPNPDIIVSQQIIRIENAQVQIGNVWTPMRQISNSDYYRQSIPEGVAIIPNQFAYNRTSDPYDRFMLSMASASSYPIRISCGGPVQNYELDDFVDLPRGYYTALKYALAEFLCIGVNLPDTVNLMNLKYMDAQNKLKDVNAAPPPKLKLGGPGGLWSIGVDRVLYPNQGLG